MITTNLTGNLGNHMWQYTVCRVIAEKLGYDWGIDSSPTHDYYKGMNQMYFMDVDFGKEVDGHFDYFYENWINYHYQGENVNITMYDPNILKIQDNTKLLGHNGAFGGLFQSEKYLDGFEEKISKWFNIKTEFVEKYNDILTKNEIVLDENMCVINFRGGEYRMIPKIVCRKKYWVDSINHMKSINPNMKFIVVTDDPEFSSHFMPYKIPTYHFDIGLDFFIVNQSKWTIISNSTFSWWSAWLNNKSNKILAPMYFAAHNFSDGFWGLGESYSKKFSYINRDGTIVDYEECKKMATEYYKQKKII